MDASRAERDTELLLYLGLLGHDFSVIAGCVLRRFFVVSKMITIILPSFQNLFPLPGRNWGCHPYDQNVEDFKMWHIRFCSDKLMTTCAAKHVITRVHVFISITVITAADIPEEYKPAAETEQSKFYSVMKNLWCQKHKEQIKQKGHPSPSAFKTINYAKNSREKCNKNRQNALGLLYARNAFWTHL